MEIQPQNPEFRNDPENFHSCVVNLSDSIVATPAQSRLITL